jgi:hypothetical protein
MDSVAYVKGLLLFALNVECRWSRQRYRSALCTTALPQCIVHYSAAPSMLELQIDSYINDAAVAQVNHAYTRCGVLQESKHYMNIDSQIYSI